MATWTDNRDERIQGEFGGMGVALALLEAWTAGCP
jgi:hypothetical protein